MAQQFQESDSATPDKQALISVLRYLKKQNLKETEEALKKELGVTELNVASGLQVASVARQRGETEPAKYEECYASQEPSSSTCTTTDLQSASNSMETEATSPSKSPHKLKEEKRSFSWPGSLPHWQQCFPTPSTLFYVCKSVATPNPKETKAHDKAHIEAKDDDKTLPQGATGLQLVHPTMLTLQNAPQKLSQTPAGTQFMYQVSPTAGFSVQPPVLTPVLTVLPPGLVNPSTNTAPIQPVILTSTPGLSLPSVTLPTITQEVSRTKPQSIPQNRSPPEPTTGQQLFSPVGKPIRTMGYASPPRTLASIPYSEMTPAFSELKAFAEEFKTKRIRLGYTQGAVGQSLADKGYSNFAQSTISRFEQMQLSPTNAAAIKQVLEKWLQEAESPTSAHSSSSGGPAMTARKRKKRAVFTPLTRSTLEEFFRQSPRPNRQQIEAMAHQLDLLPEEVRVWFCNKRQKQKQHQNLQVVFHSPYKQDVTTSATLNEASSPSSFYDRRSMPSPRTSFTIEELSKSSANSSPNSSPVGPASPITTMSPPEVATTTSAQMFYVMLAPSTTTASQLVPPAVTTQTMA